MKLYKKFFIQTLLLFLICAIFIPTGLIVFGNYFIGKHVYSKGSAHINYWIETKKNRAIELNKHGNKIVFLSGSNTLHSLDSKYASKKTGLPVLNYGVHADFGTYIFDEVKDILKKGDVVILPLEFNYYQEDSNSALPAPFAEYIISYDNNYYKQASVIKKLGLVFFLIQYYTTHPTVIYEKNLLDESYTSQLNDYGDFVGHIGTTENFLKNGKPMTFAEKIPDKFNKFALYKFTKYCKAHGIRIYATMPTTWHAGNLTQEEIIAYNNIRDFYQNQGVTFIGDATSGILTDKKMFNDTGYHTNELGTKIRTDWFIENILSREEIKDLKNYVK